MKTTTLPQGIPTKPLERADETRLAKNIRRFHREEDAVKLAMHSLCEAIPYVYTVSKGQVPQDEILSFSYRALNQAARNFKPGKLRFFCYAKVYLRSELAKWWKEQDIVREASTHESPGLDSWAHLPITPDTEENADPEFNLINIKERWAIVKPLLNKLTERERLVLEMVYIGGFTYTEISRLLVPRVTRQAICCCHERALQRMRLAISGLNRTVTI